MDEETKQFLTSLVGGLENNLRREFVTVETLRRELRETARETESRILQRVDELISEAKVELLSSMNQWKRTRDLRIFALESRLGEIEKRVDAMEDGKQ